MTGKQQGVHVRINDAATGKPTPVRVRFTDEAGTYHAPLGRLTRFSTERGIEVGGSTQIDGEAWAYVDGAFEILLPPGRFRVQVAKGPEYRPLDETHVVQAGRLSMRLTIERDADLRGDRWLAGDACTHFLAPHAALIEAAGEDLAVLNLLATESRSDGAPALANICAFSGQEPCLSLPGHLVAVNTLNASTLGRLLLLHCHRVVYPLSFDHANESWILEDWCDQCHRKKGLVVADDFFGSPNRPDEMLAEIVRGKIDAVRIADPSQFEEWYALLDAGIRIPAVAGSGKDRNVGTVGSQRTYARIEPGQELSYRGWIDAVRSGRTIVSNGPLLGFSAAGVDPGDAVDGERTVEVSVWSSAQRIEIVANGEVAATAVGAGTPQVVRLDLRESGWIAARCVDSNGRWAHASPIFVVSGTEPVRRAEARKRWTARLDENLTWARTPGSIADGRAAELMIAAFVEAKAKLQRQP